MSMMKVFMVGCLGLLLLAACGGSEPEPASVNSITNVLWKWQSVTNQDTREKTTIPDPEKYTIEFKDDGTFSGTADCNSISGTYSQEGGFSITLGPTTLAFCGEASLDTVYLDLLSNIVAGGPDGSGGFALETPGGEQRMLFAS